MGTKPPGKRRGEETGTGGKGVERSVVVQRKEEHEQKKLTIKKTSFISLIWKHKYLRLATICSVSSADEVA